VQTAKDFGAEGIGLCRTEHMFFEADRLGYFREMILAEDQDDREAALAKILPVQREDFASIFRIMEDRPCTIRLLDPPLHEFLPHTEADIESVAKTLGVPARDLMLRAHDLQESNPMLGHRGCRLGISYPEIYEMQARAILEAQKIVSEEMGVAPVVEIMVPLVSSAKELEILKGKIDAIAKDVEALDYIVGTMIELPRAALRAADIAHHAEFFSFGTNDLTQTTFGLSRYDAGRFLPDYVNQGIMEKDPFMTLDQEGVGDLIQIAVERGRLTRKDIKLGICGEHGGDPASVEFCHRAGLNYVSCSPYRVPIARLAAAHAAIKEAADKTT
jgi:pyruvate,orthophosphate dikinase